MTGEPRFIDPLTGRPLRPDENPVRGVPGPPPPSAPVSGAPQELRPASGRHPLALAIAVVVAAAFVVTGAVVAARSGTGTSSAQGAAPQPTTTTRRRIPLPNPTRILPPPSPWPSTVDEITVPPLTPGWHGVLSPLEKIAYDVPPDWKVELPGTITGFEGPDGKPDVTMHGVSTYKPGACPDVRNSYRGRVGLASSPRISPERAATDGAKAWAEAAGSDQSGATPPVTVSPPRLVQIAAGVPATLVAATTRPLDPGDCPAPSFGITAVSFENGDRTVLFVLVSDLEVADSPPPADLDKIVKSLRPHRS
jgi:hypothetical protein